MLEKRHTCIRAGAAGLTTRCGRGQLLIHAASSGPHISWPRNHGIHVRIFPPNTVRFCVCTGDVCREDQEAI